MAEAQRHKARLTSGPVGSTLFFMAIPMVVAMFSSVAYNLVDTFFVGRLGQRPLAAMGYTFPIVLVASGISLGLGTGVGSVVARAIGAGNHRQVRRLATDGLTLALAIVAVLAVAGLLTIDPLFRLLGAEDEDLALIRQYMRIWYVGTAFVVVPMAGNNAIRATGDTKWPSLIMMSGFLLNAILDPIMIFGWWIVPRMEIAGAALATVISRATTLVFALCVLHYRERMLDFARPKLAEALDSWKRILYVGGPTAATYLSGPLSIAIVTRIASSYGHPAVAALGVGLKVDAFVLMAVMALASAMMPFIGQNWGARRLDRAIEARRQAMRFAFCWGLANVAAFYAAAPWIARCFTSDPETIRVIVLYFRIVPLSFAFQGALRLSVSGLNAINRPLVSAAIQLLSSIVLFIPLVWLGGRLYGLAGIFAGIVVSHTATGLVSIVALRRAMRKIPDEQPMPKPAELVLEGQAEG